MTVSQADLDTIKAHMDTLQEEDFPPPPSPPAPLDPITSGVVSVAAGLLLDPTSPKPKTTGWHYWLAPVLKVYAKTQYNKNFSRAQMQAIRDGLRARWGELFGGVE